MSGIEAVRALLREVVASACSQVVASVASMVISALAVGTVLMTSGVQAAAQAEVLATMDDVETRVVALYVGDEADVGLDRAALVASLGAVESVTALGPVEDVRGAVLPGVRVASRTVLGDMGRELMAAAPEVEGVRSAWATREAMARLALPEQGGAVVTDGGEEFVVRGALTLPPDLEGLGPVVLVPASEGRLAQMRVLVRRVVEVPLVVGQIRALMRDLPPQQWSLVTSESYARLTVAISGRMTRASHAVTLTVLGGAAVMTMLIVWATVVLRRRDMGRRRALGATRGMIVALTVGQAGLVNALGALVGALGVSTIRWALGREVAPLSFVVAVVVAISALSFLLAALPAWWAARRDPLVELRVP